jgi:hypothetical protein
MGMSYVGLVVPMAIDASSRGQNESKVGWTGNHSNRTHNVHEEKPQ